MKQPLLRNVSISEQPCCEAATTLTPRITSLTPFRDVAYDFANTLKAFIGANYLAAPFAFSKAGWILGTFILTITAALTFHCCALLIKCKFIAVSRINARTGEDPNFISKRLQYPDIGREAFGQTGYVAVALVLGLSQTGFCIGYLIFVRATLEARLLCKLPHAA
jgi:proton-coupled amino acid transporter